MERIISQDFKETEIGSLPKEWQVVRLGDITEIKYGKSNPNISGNIPVVGSGGTYDYTSTPLVNFPTIVIGRKGTAGKTWLMEIPSYPSDTTFYLIIKRELLLKFIYYYMLKYPLSGEHAKTTLPSLQKPDIENYYIPLPPLPEQKAIANVLSTVQENIKKTEAVINSTKELKKSLMNHLFTYGPVPINETEKVKLKETDMGLIPEDWNVVNFTKCIDKSKINIGSVKKDSYLKFGKYPIIDQGQKKISGYSNDFDLVYKGTLPVIIFGDHTKIFKFIDFPFACGADGTKIIVPKSELFSPNFFYYFLANLAIPNRGYNRHYSLLKEQFILRPPLPIQKQIADILSAVDSKIEAEENKARALEKLFQSLLNDLMTGKIRVREEIA